MYELTDGYCVVIIFHRDFVVKSDESVFTYSVSLRWDITDTTAVYLRIAKGFRPGRSERRLLHFAGPDVPRTFDSDSLISYEIGMKTDLWMAPFV